MRAPRAMCVSIDIYIYIYIYLDFCTLMIHVCVCVGMVIRTFGPASTLGILAFKGFHHGNMKYKMAGVANAADRAEPVCLDLLLWD